MKLCATENFVSFPVHNDEDDVIKKQNINKK